jgi:hypothetical protein
MTEGITGSTRVFSPRAEALLRRARQRPDDAQPKRDPGAILEKLRGYRYAPPRR